MFNMAHLHLMLNHIPIIGSVILLLFFTHAIIFKKDNVIKTSFFLYIIIALLAIIVYVTGDPSAEIIKKLPGVNESIIEEHENYAFISLLFFILAGAFSLLALLMMNKKNVLPKWFNYSLLIVALISVLTVSYAAKTGGQIMHPEITNQLPNGLQKD